MEHKDEIIAEKEKVRDDFRDEEMKQAFDRLVKDTTEKINEGNITIDGLPYINRGGDLPDVQAIVPEKTVRDALIEAMPAFFKAYFEIIEIKQ